MMVQGPPTDAQDLAARQRAFESEPAEALLIPVDGDRVSFTVWHESDRWWAAGTHAGNGLVLEARGIDPGSLALEEVHDIEPYLTGSRSRIRAARGEN
ncbi:hypothetical protein [Paenarthrobacter ureafaciens]|uniref:hypothetical protein n=1 Tax=Paenarthrobacter ureafaciens TaxID=37931 RepID=UPI00226F3EBD|nr:hypothetical protein [Paenarthrobacter ureafaciens]MCY0975558.1 hypothetical protein [Paenarthrobacter ureafaciens]